MKFFITLTILAIISVSSFGQADQSGEGVDKLYCARQMISLLPILNKLGQAAADNNKIAIVRQAVILKKRANSLQTYCGITLPTPDKASNPLDCVAAANDIYNIAAPLIGHPSSFADTLAAFQDLMDIVPQLGDSCGADDGEDE